MLKLLPILLLVVGAYLYARLLARQTERDLAERSVDLLDPGLEPTFRRLAQALDLPRIRVLVYDSPLVNGLASADGRIILTRGFHDRFRQGQVTADELAGVVAHELGHVALGHARRRLIDFTGQNAIRMVLVVVLGRLLPGLGSWIAHGLMALLMSGLSRRDEYEADAYASALLIKSGIGTDPQKSLFRKLDALTGHGHGPAPAWLLTHPKSQARIAAIESNEARWLRSPDAPA